LRDVVVVVVVVVDVVVHDRRYGYLKTCNVICKWYMDDRSPVP